tara:strand:- start:306 stop:761 length:456 start_codon:yes stop_codon:yes gene_type:complete
MPFTCLTRLKKVPQLICLCCGVILFTAAGCGSGTEKVGRLSVTGTVKREKSNQAVEGSISFIPKNKGPSATTQIIAGEYAFTNENGPVSGEYEVLVSAQKEQDPTKQTAGSDDTSVVLQKMNSGEWTFSIVVSPDSQTLEPFVLNTKSDSK